MVVAVIAVRMVQVAADQVVDVLAVWHRFVAAIRPVLVGAVVLGALMALSAIGGVDVRDRDRVALDPTLAVVVQLAVMEMIDVIAVADRGMTAAGTVLVLMCVIAHRCPFVRDGRDATEGCRGTPGVRRVVVRARRRTGARARLPRPMASTTMGR